MKINRVHEKKTEKQVSMLGEVPVKLFGRTYFSGNELVLYNVGTGLEFCFDGESVSAEITASADCYFTVFLDDARDGNFIKAYQGTQIYLLAKLAGQGTHIIRIVKSSEINVATLKIKQITGAKHYFAAPVKSKYFLEFIGDSITAGYGARTIGGEWSVDNSDVCRSFSYLTAWRLKADYSIIAREGICVNVDYFGCGYHMTELYSYNSWETKDRYDFFDQPNAVILGLGTNDAFYLAEHPEYENNFVRDYRELLVYIRGKRPAAKIVCVYGMMEKDVKIEMGIECAINKIGDGNISYFSDFTPNSDGGHGHPSSKAHEKNAEILSKYLSRILEIGAK